MAIDFPNSPVNGTTYNYLGVQYTYNGTVSPGFWYIATPGNTAPATGAEVDAGTNEIKFLSPKSIEDSSYIKLSELEAWAGHRMLYTTPVLISDTSAVGDYTLNLSSYIPNGGEVVLSFYWAHNAANTQSWAGIAPSNAVPTWDQDTHTEMSVASIDSASRKWSGAGNLYKTTSTNSLVLHREGGAERLLVRIMGYKAYPA